LLQQCSIHPREMVLTPKVSTSIFVFYLLLFICTPRMRLAVRGVPKAHFARTLPSRLPYWVRVRGLPATLLSLCIMLRGDPVPKSPQSRPRRQPQISLCPPRSLCIMLRGDPVPIRATPWWSSARRASVTTSFPFPSFFVCIYVCIN